MRADFLFGKKRTLAGLANFELHYSVRITEKTCKINEILAAGNVRFEIEKNENDFLLKT
jgi:hypothetical protein